MVKMKEYFQVVEVPRSVKKDVTGLIDRGAILDEKISVSIIVVGCLQFLTQILIENSIAPDVYSHSIEYLG